LTQNDRKEEKISKNCKETKKNRRRKQLKFKEEEKNIGRKKSKKKTQIFPKDTLRIWYCLNLPLSKFILFFS
jgi:hypothetical protein